MKNNDQRMPEYSVWKPATSSDSASGKSNGARLFSAMPLMRKMTKASGWYRMNQMESVACEMVMPDRLSVRANISAPTSESPIETSYETICAEERRPPRS